MAPSFARGRDRDGDAAPRVRAQLQLDADGLALGGVVVRLAELHRDVRGDQHRHLQRP